MKAAIRMHLLAATSLSVTTSFTTLKVKQFIWVVAVLVLEKQVQVILRYQRLSAE